MGNTANSAVTINSALAINPSTLTLAVNNLYTFSATGGVSPYTYSVASGGGSIGATTGAYVAGASSGSASILVTDSLGNTSTSAVTINAALAISPTTFTLAVNDLKTFSASGGVTPYSFSVVFGGGSINAATGAYTAPASAGSATVQVRDSLGNTSNASVTINAALAISPTGWVMGVNQTKTFVGSGGVAPYTFSVSAGTGSVNSSTGVYTAPASFGTATVLVTDSLANTASANVVINNAVSISPNAISLAVGDHTTFGASAGLAPYTFSATIGSINSSTGAYIAPPSCGSYPCTDTVTVTDASSQTSSSTVTLYAAIQISPSSKILALGNTTTFSATGGVVASNYHYTATRGAISATTGAYTAPGTSGADTVTVTDDIGNTSSATLMINPALAISPATRSIPIINPTSLIAVGGVSPFTYIIQTNTASPGSIQSCVAGSCSTHASCTTSATTTCQYTAGSTTSQTATLRVTDSLNNTATATIKAVTPVQVATGGAHVCSLMDDGTIQCWGNNTAGQLGNGSLVNSAIPVQVYGISNATQLSIDDGAWQGCALLSTGQVSCWGNNFHGYMGQGTSNGVQPIALTVPGITTATAVAAGGGHVCALLADTSVQCWGSNYNGQLGNGTRNDSYSPTPVLTSGGGNPPLTGVTALAAGGDFTCAIMVGGTVQCWGGQSNGELGNGIIDNINNQYYPAAVPGLNSTSKIVAGSDDHACVVDAGSGTPTLYCWGNNWQGQIGIGTYNNNYSTPQSTGVTGVSLLTAGDNATCVVDGSSDMSCWGYNYQGELGNFNGWGETTPTLVDGPISNAISIAISNTACAVLSTGVVKCWGGNQYGQIGNGSTQSVVTPTVISGLSGSAIQVANGVNYVCALISTGTVQCWGYNGNGELGNGITTTSTTPVTVQTSSGVNLTGVIAIDASYQHTCALQSGGNIYCWGWNQYGQLGEGDTSDQHYATGVLGITNATAISVGQAHTCAVLSDTSLQCWGQNYNGQLGNGTTSGSAANPFPAPVLLTGSGTTCGSGNTCLTGVTQVSTSRSNDADTCATLVGGTAMCWGDNGQGQLGIGTTNNSLYPVAVLSNPGISLTGVSQMSMGTGGYLSVCALFGNGSIDCWGNNAYGQLGNGGASTYFPESAVDGISTAVSMANGPDHYCALLLNGSIQCWGRNDFGELGNGYVGSSSGAPIPVNDPSTFTYLAPGSGAERTCAVTNAGLVKCWGQNYYGEVNQISGANQNTPVNVVF